MIAGAAALALGVLVVGSSAALAGEMLGIRVGKHPDRVRVVLESDVPVLFRTQAASDGKSVVLTLAQVKWTPPVSGAWPRVEPLIGYRFEAKGRDGRLELLAKQPMKVLSASAMPPTGNIKTHRIVIDLAATLDQAGAQKPVSASPAAPAAGNKPPVASPSPQASPPVVVGAPAAAAKQPAAAVAAGKPAAAAEAGKPATFADVGKAAAPVVIAKPAAPVVGGSPPALPVAGPAGAAVVSEATKSRAIAEEKPSVPASVAAGLSRSAPPEPVVGPSDSGAPGTERTGVAATSGESDSPPASSQIPSQPPTEVDLALSLGRQAAMEQGDYTVAVRWFRRAAELGSPLGAFNAAEFYRTGKGVPQSFEQAARWYEQAAQGDFAPARFYLGLLLYDGNGVAQDRGRALELWRKAAGQGLSEARQVLEGLESGQDRGSAQSPAQAPTQGSAQGSGSTK